MTFDLGRVTTSPANFPFKNFYCGDVRSRTSYNCRTVFCNTFSIIAVTFDLGRVTTTQGKHLVEQLLHCGDVRSRTSYNK